MEKLVAMCLSEPEISDTEDKMVELGINKSKT